MTETKEIILQRPETLYDVNIAQAMVFLQVMGGKSTDELGSFNKLATLLAGMNNLNVEDVRKIPSADVAELGIHILNLFHNDKREYSLKSTELIVVKDVEYGLIPNLAKAETGAFIDLLELFADQANSLHKIMAILYRPVVSRTGSLYNISTYSDEDERATAERADIFLKHMPYGVVRSVVNFTLKNMVS